MEQLVEYWLPVAMVVGTFFGGLLLSLTGYLKKPKEEQKDFMHGALLMYSTKLESAVVALNRIAHAAEKIENQLQDTADSEAEDRRVKAAIEAAKMKWEREQRGQ